MFYRGPNSVSHFSILMASIFGVGGGYYIWKPLFEEIAEKKRKEEAEEKDLLKKEEEEEKKK